MLPHTVYIIDVNIFVLEHWASIPKVVGSIPTVARHIFQACPVWIYTQSNIMHKHHIHLST